MLRRVLSTMAVCGLAVAGPTALVGCDDGPPAATVGNPDASVSTALEVSPFPTYVALGDSYTAAPGVPQTEQESGCLRSNGNYPNLVAKQLGSDFVDVSCVGATTLSLVAAQNANNRVYPPQFSALSDETTLVTVGIGGNDVELFQTMVGTCGQLGMSEPKGAPCRDYMADAGEEKDLLLEKIDKVRARVTAALKGVRDRAPNATVVLVGYPQPVPAKGTCKILPLAKGDYPYVRHTVERLNDAMREAAKKGKAIFIDLAKASKGHDVCARQDAWVNGINTDMMRALAFHPFAEEQQAVADLILAKLEKR